MSSFWIGDIKIFNKHESVLRLPLTPRKRRATNENGLATVTAENSRDVGVTNSKYLKIYRKDSLK